MPSPSTRGQNVPLASILGTVYLLVGVAGFVVTGTDGFAETHGEKLLGVFMLNPLHNIVHLAVGGLLLLAARGGERPAAQVNTLVGAVYLLVGIVGLFVLDKSANILALNAADNALHFGSALVLLLVGLSGLSRPTVAAVEQRA